LGQAHAVHRGMLVEDGDYRGIGAPVKLSQSCARTARKPPRFGEHAAQVLAEAGCTEEQVTELRGTGVVRDRPAR
jgi:crotonobetainyl-CoA:carnitine CoA-transferase CaiB-like acyl-CoA transferase